MQNQATKILDKECIQASMRVMTARQLTEAEQLLLDCGPLTACLHNLTSLHA